MWNTSSGERKIEASEAQVVLLGAKLLFDDLTGGCIHYQDALDALDGPEGELQYPVPAVFAEMGNRTKLVAISNVVKHLTSDEPPPDLFAWNEATISAMFCSLRFWIDVELGGEDNQTDYRDVTYYAFKKIYGEHLGSLTSLTGNNWDMIVERLKFGILWDEDYEIEVLDAMPSKLKAVKELMAIEDEYYIAIPPTDTEELVAASFTHMATLG